jgi:cytoskeletal protein RodZ
MENLIIGELLKSARESKNLSIEDVSLKTKININILKSLESNKLDQLPNKTYVRGFVKTYGKLVGISTEDIIESLDYTYGDAVVNKVSTPDPSTSSQEESEEKQKQVESEDIQDNLKSILASMINKKALIGIAVIFVIVLIVKSLGAFFSQISSEQVKITKEDKISKPVVSNETDTEVESKEEVNKNIEEKNETPTPQAIAEKKAAEQKKLAEEEALAKKKLAEEKALANKKAAEERALANKKAAEEKALASKKAAEEKALANKKAAEEKALANKKAAEKRALANKKAAEQKALEKEKRIQSTPKGKYPKIDFYPAPTNMFSIIKNAPENTNTEILPLRFKNAVISGKQNIYIRAHTGDTWVSYQSDNDKIKRFVLKQGRSVLIKGEKVLLFMGNVTVAKIFYNNQLINTPTKSGVKSLIFPQEMASEYELPLFPSYKGIPIKAEDYKANMVE